MMRKRSIAQLLWIVPGIALTVGLSLAFSEQRGGQGHSLPVELLIAAGSGAVAISAMILPGISGSFVMLVVGQYQKVLEHLSAARKLDGLSILWLAALGVGCVLGLLLFSRLLHWLLHRWRSATMAFLIGLVLGSFFVLWPFKDFSAGGKVVGRSGEVKRDVQIATAPNRLPVSWTETGRNGLALLLGLAGALGVELLGRRSRGQGGKGVHTPVKCVGE
jgi:putative membrane protein